jgi:hypothetical protein
LKTIAESWLLYFYNSILYNIKKLSGEPYVITRSST